MLACKEDVQRGTRREKENDNTRQERERKRWEGQKSNNIMPQTQK